MKRPAAAKSRRVLIGRLLRGKNSTLAVAESCTGGLLSHMITNVPGSSAYFLGGVVAYGNEVKLRLLGVRAPTLERYGAVSRQTAVEMAEGVRRRLRSTAGVSITGIAGPGGGSAGKPVGTVYISVAPGGSKRPLVEKFLFRGTRAQIKKQSAAAALELLVEALAPPAPPAPPDPLVA